VSREYVNYIERGKRQPRVGMFVRLCKAMKAYPPRRARPVPQVTNVQRRRDRERE